MKRISTKRRDTRQKSEVEAQEKQNLSKTLFYAMLSKNQSLKATIESREIFLHKRGNLNTSVSGDSQELSKLRDLFIDPGIKLALYPF